MNSSELMFIKNAQKEFRARFNRELEINFEKMNNCDLEISKPLIDDLFQNLLVKHKTTSEDVCNRKNRCHSIYFKESASNCIKEFIFEVNNQGLNKSYAATLINRTRYNFYAKNRRPNSTKSNGRPK